MTRPRHPHDHGQPQVEQACECPRSDCPALNDDEETRS